MGHLSQDDGKSEKQCHWCHSNVEIAFSSPMVGGEGGGSRSGHLRIIATAHVPAVLFIRQRPASRGYIYCFSSLCCVTVAGKESFETRNGETGALKNKRISGGWGIIRLAIGR